MSDLPNKVTKEDLEHLVARSDITYTNLAGTLTHCMVTLPCGFQVTGESACVDPANDIYRAKQPTSFVSRMVFEQSDLREKLNKLREFLDKPKPDFVEQAQWDLMTKQEKTMSDYFYILEDRITLALGDEPKLLK